MISPEEKTRYQTLSFWEKFSYGIGTFGDQLTTNAVNVTVKPVYTMVFMMSPTLVGFTLMIGKIVDAFTDPVMGNISDNTRTRMGRRRPYILFGSIFSTIAFPLLWFASRDWGTWSLFTYLIIVTSIIALISTTYCVPWTALGMEMTPHYHERTHLMVYRSLLTKGIWFVIPWLWAWSQLDIFPDPIIGMRWISVGVGALVVLGGIISFSGCRERYYKAASHQDSIGILDAVRLTFKNRPFLIILGITFVQVMGISSTIGGIGLYVSTYHVYGGDLGAGAVISGWIGTVSSLVGICCIPLIYFMSQKFGKRATMAGCLGMALAGSILNWFCYTPDMPVLQLIPAVFMAFSVTAFWMINGSMRIDVVDHDEMTTGLRREGAYGSIGRWFV